MLHDWIERAAAAHGEDVYLADARDTATLTYTGLLDLARDVERRLDRAGLPAGAPIGVRLDGLVDYAAALVSIIAAGRVAVPLDPEAPDADTERSMAIAGTVAMITPGLEVELLEDGPAATRPVPGAGGIFLSTSGTTGVPKGILLREEQLMHVAASVVEAHRLTRADRGYCSLPLFHANAQVIGVLATLSAGAYLALDRKFSFGRTGFWEVIEERRITWINAVPAIITILSLDPPAVVPAGLRFVRSASAPLPVAALHAFESAVGVPVVETYGMSEASSMITANPVDGPRKPGSVGLPAGSEVRVEATDGGDAAAGEIGQVKIRGAGVICAYASGGRPGVVDADGWLDTSDLGYLDADGYLFLVGRSDDVINRGGEMIYPRDIEEILLAQPGVRSVAVIGLPDALLGERPVAYVVPAQPGLRAEALEKLGAALRATCESRLSPAKQPSDFRFIEELPLGPTGKISSRALKDLVTARS